MVSTETQQAILDRVLHGSIYREINFNNTLSFSNFKSLSFDVCFDFPPKIFSDGIWGHQANGTLPSQSTLPLFEFQILTIFLITQTFHFVLKRLGVPYFVSQIMAGFVLGPSLKGPNSWTKFRKFLFPYGSEDILASISIIGYGFYLFLNNVRMDFSMITRTGRKSWAIALSSFAIPTTIGLYFFYSYPDFFDKYVGALDAKSLPVLVIGQSGCSFSVVSSLLSDLEILNSELGRLALSTSLLLDLIGTLVTGFGAAIISSLESDNGTNVAIMSAVKLLALVTFIPLLMRPLMNWFVRLTPEGRPVRKVYTYIVILIAFFFGYVGMYAHQSVLAGVVIVGFVVPEGPPLGSELIKQFELFSCWFLLPIFVTCCAMKVDVFPTEKYNYQMLLAFLVIVFTVHFLKVIITIGICQLCKMPKTDGLCLALMLGGKGVVDFCTNTFVYDSLLLSTQTLANLSVAILVSGTISRNGVKFLYDPVRKYAGYQRRNMMNLNPNSELKIVSCLHKPSHIVPTKNFLDMCCPSPTNPLAVHVLHLMELVGTVTPIFISHQLQERMHSGRKFSEDVIISFDLFEHDYAGSASVSTYTAISVSRFMHDDICYLALDKLASLILLPFHVRWANDGSVDSKDENMRSLNARVLKRAPCSVGILVNRGTTFKTDSKQIALIFLGGSDDREAMYLAKRSIKEDPYKLVVYHLVSSNKCEYTDWDCMLDDEVLKGVKGTYGNLENVKYEKITIENDTEVTPIIFEIASIHDFIIVGRRNGDKSSLTEKLEMWTEYSELGVIGDLLASSYANTKASILVVQQHAMAK